MGGGEDIHDEKNAEVYMNCYEDPSAPEKRRVCPLPNCDDDVLNEIGQNKVFCKAVDKVRDTVKTVY